jgi:hypothetical protein
MPLARGGGGAQAQIAEQYEKIETTSLSGSENLASDLVIAGASWIRPRLIEKQLVVGPRQAAKFLVEDREAMADHRDHCASEAQIIKIAARLIFNAVTSSGRDFALLMS